MKKNRREKGPRHNLTHEEPGRPDAEFTALEFEFFARESELYQVVTVETFEDLDKKK